MLYSPARSAARARGLACRQSATAAATLLLLAAVPAHAGTVYAGDHTPAVQALAHVPGVYAVWALPDLLRHDVRYEIVLRPGATARDTDPKLRAALAPLAAPPLVSTELIDVWTWRDPMEATSFRSMIGDAFPGPLGFPDFRDVKVATLTLSVGGHAPVVAPAPAPPPPPQH